MALALSSLGSWPALLVLANLAAVQVSGFAAPRVKFRAAKDPGPSPLCPADMRLVEGVHYEEVEHLCINWHKGPKRCWAFYPELSLAHGNAKPMKFCMDQFEAPNKRGAKPLVMQSFRSAKRWCERKHKRLCAEAEFETACEGNQQKPFFYGYSLDGRICNTSRAWKKVDFEKFRESRKAAAQESARLWQGSKSGRYAECRTPHGIYDLLGNVEEWVVSSRPRKFPGALMGGFWAKPWVGCRGTNDAHGPGFAFYETGFRCCADPAKGAQPAAAD